MQYFLSLLLLLAATAAGAATPRDLQVVPRLAISAPTEKPVTLDGLRITTDIRGSVAVTSVEMRFFNPNPRQLEGELQFPLLDGQRVIGMAMDIDGKLRDAVPVDKARGQEVFEEITRAQIDPALLQVTQGNNYKLRVFPILPNAHKTVVIRYMESLRRSGERHVYRLPLQYAERLSAFDLTVTVNEKPAQQRAESIGELAFERSGRFYTAHITREKFAPRGVLELTIPSADRSQVYTQMRDGRTYFYAEVPVRTASTARVLPRSIGLIWDSSGSGAQRDHAREFALLDAYFQKAGNVEVRLTRVRDAAEPAESFSVRGGDWRTLRRALESTVYDGATNFGAFAQEPKASIQEYLLFTDGLRNFGGSDLPALGVPVYAISSSTQNNPDWLAQVAHKSNGRYLNLVSETPAEAARQLLSHTTRILSLDTQGASQVVTASPYPDQGLIRVAGVANAARARLQLGIGMPGAPSRTVEVDIGADAVDSPFASLMWAGLRVSELDADYRLNRAEIRRLGKAFGMTTRETSLIVLDRIEDYVRFEILPPAELRAEYDRLQFAARERLTIARGSQLERVVKLFEQKKAWWAREFPKGERPAVAMSKENDRGRANIGIRGLEESPQPLARPAPSAPPPPARMVERRSADSAAQVSAGSGAGPGSPAGTAEVGIQLRKWTPDAPYIARFARAETADLYRIYLDERPGYASSTAYFLDAADVLLEKGQTDLGVRVLSNLSEMDLENRHVLRILGYRLLQAGKPRLAIPVFQQVLELSPEEPQSYRDLGLAYAADKQYQKAVESLYEVVVRPWHARFPEIELTAIAEMNAIVAEAQRARVKVDTARIDPRLLANLPLDVRVVLTWDADNTDIDLWVTDPSGEKGYYGNRMTYQGGRMSPDFTGGYGPEEFSLKGAKPGKYLVQVNFYGHRRTTVSGATTLQVKLITGFGTERQQERITTLRLRDRSEIVTIGEFEVRANP